MPTSAGSASSRRPLHVLLLRLAAGESGPAATCYQFSGSTWIGPRGNVVVGAAASNGYVFVGFRQESYKAFDHTLAVEQSGHGQWSTHDVSVPTAKYCFLTD